MTDPYASYGGAVAATPPPPQAAAPAATDPYASYGGQTAAPAASTPAAASPTGGREVIHVDPSEGIASRFLHGVESVGAGIGDDLLGSIGGTMELINKGAEKLGVHQTMSDLVEGRPAHIIPAAITDDIKRQRRELEATNAENPTLNSVGNATGLIAEFLSGEEVLKGLSLGAKLQKIAPMLRQLERFPKALQAFAEVAARQGTVGAVRAKVHGATNADALESGAVTGALGGAAELAIPAAYGAVKNLITKIRPGTTEIAGEVIPRLASQAKGAEPAAAKAATIANAPEVAAAQQAGGQQAVTNVAQRATKNALERVNGTRATAPIMDPARVLEAPKEAQAFRFHIDGPPTIEGATSPEGGPVHYAGTREVANPNYKPLGTPEVEAERAQLGTTAEAIPDQAFTGEPTTRASNWQYTPPEAGAEGTNAIGGGRLVTNNPATAQSALTRLKDLTHSATFDALPEAQRAAIEAQRDSLQQQLGMYHAGEGLYPHFQPVDAAQAVGHVTNFGEAADQVQAAVKPVYQKLDEVSGGNFTALRNQMKAASKVMFQPGSMDAYEKALESHAEAEKGIQELFNRHAGDVGRVELQSANAAWRDSVVLDKLHSAVEGAFKGAPKDIADTIGSRRLLRGDSLTSRLNALLKKTPQAEIERVIGADGLQNLYRVADLLSKPDTAIATQNVAKETARELFRRVSRGALVGGLLGHLVGHAELGAVAGASAEDAARYVLRQAAVNPRVGALVDRAVRHQVNPKIFAPLIAATLNRDEPEQEGQQQ